MYIQYSKIIHINIGKLLATSKIYTCCTWTQYSSKHLNFIHLLLVYTFIHNPIRTGVVGPFLMLCPVLSCDSCTHNLWLLHGWDVPLFMWCYCYQFCRKMDLAYWRLILCAWHPIRWRWISRWILYMLSFYNWYYC